MNQGLLGYPTTPTQLTFRHVGREQTFLVPPGVSSLQVTLYGAQGARALGGRGAVVTGALTVTPGEILYMYVGGRMLQGLAAFGGGGAGWNGLGGTSGGGATDVRQGGNALANRVAIAAGGGGGGQGNSGVLNVPGGDGGLVGGAGTTGTSNAVGGGGATLVAAGSGGTGGGLGQGAAGVGNGSGGGGGLYGGGGGNTDTVQRGGGGGGGSSLVPLGGNMVNAVNFGEGLAVVTYDAGQQIGPKGF